MTTQTPTPAQTPRKPLSLRYTARCEIGLVRKNNQDSCYVSPTMLVVADGMGGAAAGDLASAVVIREMRTADAPHAGQDMCTLLGDAVDRATKAIAELVETDPGLDGMGSTVTGLMFDRGEAAVVNIGDSRTYIFRDRVLTRLSHDHSWVQSLVDEGRISEEESLVHPHRSLILRVINGQPQHVPDLGVIDLQPGDRLLVCSDGLCGFVTDEVIERAMAGELDFVMERLTGIAHRQGGLDNITIIVADVVEGPPEGLPQVYGAAALLDLDAPLDKTLTIELIPEDSVFAPQGPPSVPPRPDPALPEQTRYAPTKPGVGTWVKVLVGLLIPVVVIAVGGWAWYQFTQQQYYVGANGDTVAVFRGVPGEVFGYPLSSVVNPAGPTISDLPRHYQQVVRENQTVTSRDQGNAMLSTLQGQADKCVQARSGPTQSPPTDPYDPSTQDPNSGTQDPNSGTPGTPGTPGSQSPNYLPSPTYPSPTKTATPDPTDCE